MKAVRTTFAATADTTIRPYANEQGPELKSAPSSRIWLGHELEVDYAGYGG
jgi:hypothetical protein